MKESAGLLLFRRIKGGLEVLLVHPGGPFWARKDIGVWSIPKGEIEPDEDLVEAALREFKEETGFPAPAQAFPLGSIRQTGGKRVHAFAAEGDCDPSHLRSNDFTLEWPPRSGERTQVPEIDRAEWFSLPVARQKINKGQAALLDALERAISNGRPVR